MIPHVKCIKIQIQDTSEKKNLIQDTYLVPQILISNTCILNTTHVW